MCVCAEVNWSKWTLNESQQDFLEFCKQVIALRKSSVILTDLSLKDDDYNLHHNVDEVNWYRPDGENKLDSDWQDPQKQSFAVELKGCPKHTDEHLLMIFNTYDHDVRFHLPELKTGYWSLELDTRYKKISLQPKTKIANVFLQAYRSVTVFKRTYD